MGSGASYTIGALGVDLHADVELAVELGADVSACDGPQAALAAVGGYSLALELVDLAPVLTDAVAVVAANVFHRAVAFGPTRSSLPTPPVVASAVVNDERRVAAQPADELAGRLAAAARIVEAAGERLRLGDRIITGSVVQVPVGAGDRVRAEIAGWCAVELQLA